MLNILVNNNNIYRGWSNSRLLHFFPTSKINWTGCRYLPCHCKQPKCIVAFIQNKKWCWKNRTWWSQWEKRHWHNWRKNHYALVRLSKEEQKCRKHFRVWVFSSTICVCASEKNISSDSELFYLTNELKSSQFIIQWCWFECLKHTIYHVKENQPLIWFDLFPL